jgi:hypothetical protein
MKKNLFYSKSLTQLLVSSFLLFFLLPNMGFAQLNCAGVVIDPTPAPCPGQGAITITLPANFGGSAPYTFTGTGPSSFPSQSNTTISSLKAGLYSVTINDASGNFAPCVFSNINITTTYVPMQMPIASWVGCQAQVTVVGGKAPYTFYAIDPSNPNGTPLDSIKGSNTTYTFSKLTNGTKAIKIKDACGQTVTTANGLVNYTPLLLAANFVLPGTVNTAVTSSTNSLYTYKLFLGGVQSGSSITTTDKNYSFTGVVPECNDNYVMVSDTTCSDSKTTYFSPPNATPELTVNCVTFSNGTASVSAIKGKAPYTYECYDNLATKIATSTTGNFTGITASSVYFRVVDACGKTSLTSKIFNNPYFNFYNAVPNCATSTVSISAAFLTGGTAPVFVPLKFTALNSNYTSTSPTASFTKDFPTNFVIKLEDNCGNGVTIKDTITFPFLPNQPCKSIKVGTTVYSVKYLNGSVLGNFFFNAAPNSLTYNLYDGSVLVSSNSTGVFTNLNYNKLYTVELVTPCGLKTTNTITLPAPTGNPNVKVVYSCSGNSLTGAISPAGLTPPMSITTIPSGVTVDFGVQLPLGTTYKVEDCTGSTIVEIKASSAPQPEEVYYQKSYTCVGNKYKHTIYAFSNNLGSGPYTLKDINGTPMSTNDGKTFANLDAGTYFLNSDNSACTKETKIVLTDDPKKPIYATTEGPICLNGVFHWNIKGISSYYNGVFTLKDASGTLMTASNAGGTAFDNLKAGTYYINGQCAEEKAITFTDPTPAQIPHADTLECKNNQLLYKIVVPDNMLKPFKLLSSSGAIIPSFGNDGLTFVDLMPGTYTLTGLCSANTIVDLPGFPAMPKIEATKTGNCPTNTFIEAKANDIGMIWSTWLVGKTVAIPPVFTACGGGGQYILKNLSTNNTFTVIGTCAGGKFNGKFANVPPGDYELTLSSCAYISEKVNITILPHIIPIVEMTRGVVCSSTDKTDLEMKIKSTSFPVKIEKMSCGFNPTATILEGNYNDTVFVHKNLGIGSYCYRITDVCGVSDVGTTSAVALLGSIRPNYRDSCGYITLRVDKLLKTTYKWTSPPSNVVLSTTEKLIVKAETFDRNFRVEVSLPNNTICVRNITIKANSGISPIPEIQDKTKLTTCIEKGNIPLNVVISNGVPSEFVTKVEWLDETKTVLGTGYTFNAPKTGKYFVKITNDSVNIQCKYTYDSVIVVIPIAKLDAKPIQKNITCFKDQDGKINMKVEGGILPYKFLWSNAKTTEEITGLDIGTYSCTVTDSIKCTVVKTFTITEPKILNFTIKQLNTNNCDAKWSIKVTGGTPPYKVSFDNEPSVTTSDTTVLCVKAGTHTVNVVDDHNCKFSMTKNFEKHDIPIKENKVYICHNTSYTIGKHTYKVDGVYLDTLSSNVNCGQCDTSWRTTLKVLQPVEVKIEISSIKICGGKTPATVKLVEVKGGMFDTMGPCSSQGTYNSEFSWTGAKFKSLRCKDPGYDSLKFTMQPNTSNFIKLEVIDQLGCRGQMTIDNLKGIPEIFLQTPDNPTCYVEGCTGEIQLKANYINNAPGVFTYQWSNGAVVPNIKDVCFGKDYSVTVTDENGCTATDKYNLENGKKIIVLFDKKILSNKYCKGSKTLIKANFDYSGPGANNFALYTVTVNGVQIPKPTQYSFPGPGTYKFHIIKETAVSSQVFCETDTTIIIPSYPNLGTQVVQKDSLCAGSTVVLNAYADPKVKVKSYAFYNSDWSVLGTINTPAEVKKGGIFYLVQADESGCIDTVKHKINAFEPPSVTIDGVTEICDGDKGELTAKITNNNLNHKFSYKWTLNGVSVTKDSSTIDASKLGKYAVTVTNLLTGCSTIALAEVKEVSNWTPIIEQKTALCEGKNTTLTAVVGKDVLIKWFKDGVYQSQLDNQKTITVSSEGKYSVEVTKGKCSGKSKGFEVRILKNPDLKLAPEVTVCTNKDFLLKPESNTAGLNFAWSTKETVKDITVKKGSYSVTATDKNGCSATLVTDVKEFAIPPATITSVKPICPNEKLVLALDQTFSSYDWGGNFTPSQEISAAGTYNVTVTDKNSCTNTASIKVEAATPVLPVLSGDSIVCKEGKGTILVKNSTDFKSIEWQDGSTKSIFEFNSKMDLWVKTIDKNLCLSKAIFKTDLYPVPTVLTKAPTVCDTKSGEIEVIGNFKGYLWDDKSKEKTLTVNETGTYEVTVTDDKGCVAVASTIFELKKNPVVKLNGPSEICIGKAVKLSADTKPGYAFQWSGGNTSKDSIAVYKDVGTFSVTITDEFGCVGTNEITVISAASLKVKTEPVTICSDKSTTLSVGKYDTYQWSNGDTTKTIKTTTAGTYYVTVSSDGCKGVGAIEVTMLKNPDLTLATKPLICKDAETKIVSNLKGMDIKWGNGTINKDSITVKAGTYSATVTDKNGCSATASVTIQERPLLIPEALNGEACDSNLIKLELKDPSLYTTIGWDSGEKTASINVDKAGVYKVKVIDLNGCEGENTAKATFNPLPKVNIQANTIICKDKTTDVKANTDLANKILWQNGKTDAVLNVGAGFYAVTVTSPKNCKATDKIEIKEQKSISAELLVKGNKLCSGDSSVLYLTFKGLENTSTSVTIGDGVGFFTIKNITQDTFFALKPTEDKSYFIQSISVKGYDCDIAFNKNKFEVKVSQLKATLTAQSQSCYGIKDGKLDLSTNADSYVWNIPAFGKNQKITNLGAGIYSVDLSDALGCKMTLSKEIIEPKPIDMTVLTKKTCIGQKDGTLEMKASGGAGSLVYYVNGKPYNDGRMSNLAQGTYSAMVKDKNGCTSKTEIVKVENFPVTTLELYAGDTTSIVKGYDSLTIRAIIKIDGKLVTDVKSAGFQNYQWLPYACPDCLSIVARTDSSTTYSLKITDKNGCKVKDKLRIGVEELVREVDSPNGVTTGNPFKILNPERSVRKINALRIFDRLGNMVYQELNFTPKSQIGWDGSFRDVECDPGVYVWIAVVEFLDGSTKIFRGDITVIR